jgi:heme o synthase
MPGMLRNYWRVTKPGIIFFGNLISVMGGFFLASIGRVDIAMLLSTVIGISLVIASACVLNNCVDRDVDRKMTRTRDRVPLCEAPVKFQVAQLDYSKSVIWDSGCF